MMREELGHGLYAFNWNKEKLNNFVDQYLNPFLQQTNAIRGILDLGYRLDKKIWKRMSQINLQEKGHLEFYIVWDNPDMDMIQRNDLMMRMYDIGDKWSRVNPKCCLNIRMMDVAEYRAKNPKLTWRKFAKDHGFTSSRGLIIYSK